MVGLGNHARTKLIPAIEANGQTLVALVTRQPLGSPPNVPVFAELQLALSALPKDTAIVIASPPILHYPQALVAVNAGFDVIVEKPAFVTAAEVREISEICSARGIVLIEAFMQRYTRLYCRILDFIKSNSVCRLDLAFIIPALPTGTFRDRNALDSSGLYDMGCYILSMLSDLDLNMDNLHIVGVENAGTAQESVDLAGTLDGIALTARIGVGPHYRNCATVVLANGLQTEFYPVFYGRAGARHIGDETFYDGNAFEAMFSIPREQWRADQDLRLARIATVTAKLETLGAQLLLLRSSASTL
jgi:Oxidoreductase family, NAD-binding Rossmann fold